MYNVPAGDVGCVVSSILRIISARGYRPGEIHASREARRTHDTRGTPKYNQVIW